MFTCTVSLLSTECECEKPGFIDYSPFVDCKGYFFKSSWNQAPTSLKFHLLPQCHANTGQWLFIGSSNSRQEKSLQFTSCAFVRGFGLFFLFNLLRHLRYVLLGLRSLIYVSGCTFFRSLIISTPPQFHDSLPAVNIVTFCNFMLLLVYYVVCF